MRDGFDETAFLQYLIDKFPESMNDFVYGLLSNIIEYAYRTKCVSKDQFVNFLYDMMPRFEDVYLPEITFEEIILFAEDGILTKDTIELKRLTQIKMRERMYQWEK